MGIIHLLEWLGILQRATLRDYQGDGNFTEENGWWLLARWWIKQGD